MEFGEFVIIRKTTAEMNEIIRMQERAKEVLYNNPSDLHRVEKYLPGLKVDRTIPFFETIKAGKVLFVVVDDDDQDSVIDLFEGEVFSHDFVNKYFTIVNIEKSKEDKL